VPGVEVAGVHELLGNALVMKGEKPDRTDLRGAPCEPCHDPGWWGTVDLDAGHH